jgi:hypothetical protein
MCRSLIRSRATRGAVVEINRSGVAVEINDILVGVGSMKARASIIKTTTMTTKAITR